ncbi:hypothetical protein D0T51_09115 [Parabacteroides sp. 52]|uniref:hypothetical protein n=1 Tax=unclassified Parabacteroides TaxID=2649774 RepID=UPI0013D5D3F9|nr:MULTISPECIES: hypothetical protein [unclassified Parabacteroides]MDH6535325.1 hypothetical protein [Parabacteroides sp. PM5-20]NDV55883.1 hypothetical protein [Parabacteroides sp. 52]
METSATKVKLRFIWTFLPEITISTLALLGIMDFIIALFKDCITPLLYVSLFFWIIILASHIGQFFWKNLTVSMVSSILFGLGSLYMVLAVVSEYSEFPAGDPEGLRLLLVGISLFGGLAIMAFIMPWKYIRMYQKSSL